MNPRLVVAKISGSVRLSDHWTGSQRKSWRSLDRRFCGWVSHLVWVRTSAGRPSGEPEVQGPHVHRLVRQCIRGSRAFSRRIDGLFRRVMPDMNWNAWANIDPTFRAIAEWEMSAEHARVQMSKALKTWWELNSESVRVCLEATGARDVSASSMSIAQASINDPDIAGGSAGMNRYERRVRSELSAVNHMIAPADQTGSSRTSQRRRDRR